MNRDRFGRFDGTYEELRSLANLASFLLVQPTQDDSFLVDAEAHCREKMPYVQVFRSDVDGVQEVLEKISHIRDGDLYVYLHGGLEAYAPAFHHRNPINFIPKRPYNAFCLSLPTDEATSADQTDEVFSRCRKYISLPSSSQNRYGAVVLGRFTPSAREPPDVYQHLQQSVAMSVREQEVLLDRACPIKHFRGGAPTMYAVELYNTDIRYAHVLKNKR
jgi:hypothetical protein